MFRIRKKTRKGFSRCFYTQSPVGFFKQNSICVLLDFIIRLLLRPPQLAQIRPSLYGHLETGWPAGQIFDCLSFQKCYRQFQGGHWDPGEPWVDPGSSLGGPGPLIPASFLLGTPAYLRLSGASVTRVKLQSTNIIPCSAG